MAHSWDLENEIYCLKMGKPMKVGKGEGKGECTNFREKFYIFPLGRDGGRIFILDLEKILKILDLEKKMTRCIFKYKVP